jgi:hypothetical protein
VLERPVPPPLVAVEEAEDGLREDLLVGLELGGVDLLPVGGVSKVGERRAVPTAGNQREVGQGRKGRSAATIGTGVRGAAAPVVAFEVTPKREGLLLLAVMEVAAQV